MTGKKKYGNVKETLIRTKMTEGSGRRENVEEKEEEKKEFV